MSLYESLKAAGIQTESHESDLYFPVTTESTAILAGFPTMKANAQVFTNQVEGGRWYDVPFAYQPWWDARAPKEFNKLAADREVGKTEPRTEV